VLDLAKRKNAVIKVSGACTLSRESYPFPDIWDPLARVFDAWGFDRCLWGTDWTRACAVVNYEQAVEPFLKTDRLSDSERAMLMGGACAKAYHWSSKKRYVSHLCPQRVGMKGYYALSDCFKSACASNKLCRRMQQILSQFNHSFYKLLVGNRWQVAGPN
jgi:hypothetical protein